MTKDVKRGTVRIMFLLFSIKTFLVKIHQMTFFTFQVIFSLHVNEINKTFVHCVYFITVWVLISFTVIIKS